MRSKFCSECYHTIEQPSLKELIKESKLWNGRSMTCDGEEKFGITFIIMCVSLVIFGVISTESLFDAEDYNLQLGIFTGLISIILIIFLLIMIIYSKGLRVVLKFFSIVIIIVILLGTILFSLYGLSEIIVEKIE